MHSQVVRFSINPANQAKVDEILDRWVSGAGKRLAGCDQVTVSYEDGGLSRVSVVVAFRDKDALDRFSSDLESLELFDEVKPFVEGSLEMFEAKMKQLSLT